MFRLTTKTALTVCEALELVAAQANRAIAPSYDEDAGVHVGTAAISTALAGIAAFTAKTFSTEIRRKLQNVHPRPAELVIAGDAVQFGPLAGCALGAYLAAVPKNIENILLKQGRVAETADLDAEKKQLAAKIKLAATEIESLRNTEQAWDVNEIPAPEGLREWLDAHNLSDSEAANICGLTNSRRVRQWKSVDTKNPIKIWHWWLLNAWVQD